MITLFLSGLSIGLSVFALFAAWRALEAAWQAQNAMNDLIRRLHGLK